MVAYSLHGSADAGPEARKSFRVIRFVPQQAIFDEMCDLLRLDQDQSDRAELLYRGYVDAVAALDARTYDRMLNAGYDEVLALRAELEPFSHIDARTLSNTELERLRAETQRNRDDPRWDRVEQLTRRYTKEYDTGRRRAYTLLEEWLAVFQDGLDLSASDFAPAARLMLRRLLEPETRRSSTPYLRSSVDVLAMIDEAKALEGELAVLAARREAIPEGGSCDDVERRVDDIALEYELVLDWHLRQVVLDRLWRTASPARSVSAPVDDFDWKPLANVFLTPWSRRQRIGERAAQAVHAMLLECGGRALGDRWHDRYQALLCPEVAKERWPHGMVEWLSEQPDHDREQLAAVEPLLEVYAARFRELRDQAVRAAIRVRQQQVFPAGTSAEQLEFARGLLQIHEVSRTTIRQLNGLLTPSQSMALSDVVHRDRGEARVELLGPRIDGASLEALKVRARFTRPVL